MSLADMLLRKEFVHCIIVSLGSMTFGYTMGYTSPTIPQIKAEFSDTISSSSILYDFFTSVPMLSAIGGSFLSPFLASPRFSLGLRKVTILHGFFGAIFWLFLLGLNAKSIWFGIITRALQGVVLGGISTLQPLYICSLAPPEGISYYGVIHQFMVCIGFLLIYLFGVWMNRKWTAFIGAIILALLAAFTWWVPEPERLKEDEAEGQKGGPKESIFARPHVGQLAIGLGLLFCQQFSGINVILTGLDGLFLSANIDMEPGYASTICSLAQIISTFASGFFIKKVGRIVAWAVSFGGMSLTCILYGICEVPKFVEKGTFPASLPIVLIFLNLLSFGFGAGPEPWFISPELFESPEMKSTGMAIISSWHWVLSFLIVLMSSPMRSKMGMHGTFIFYGVISGCAVIFGFAVVKKRGPGEGTEEESLEDNESYSIESGKYGYKKKDKHSRRRHGDRDHRSPRQGGRGPDHQRGRGQGHRRLMVESGDSDEDSNVPVPVRGQAPAQSQAPPQSQDPPRVEDQVRREDPPQGGRQDRDQGRRRSRSHRRERGHDRHRRSHRYQGSDSESYGSGDSY